MLLHNIMKSEPRRRIKRLILEQNDYPIPNCWLEYIKRRAKDVGIEVNIQEIAEKTKASYKKEIKDQIRTKFINCVHQNKTTKMRTVLQSQFKKRKYIDDGMLNPEEIRTVI